MCLLSFTLPRLPADKAMSDSPNKVTMRPGRQNPNADRERREKERLAGERPRVFGGPVARAPQMFAPRRAPPAPASSSVVPLPPKAAPAVPVGAPQRLGPSPPPQQQPPATAQLETTATAAERLLQQVDAQVKKQHAGLAGLVDSVSMRVGVLENSVKSLQHAFAALREEFSGIAQVAGGSVARKTVDLETEVHRLEKSFAEFSTKTSNELSETERRLCSVQQEIKDAVSSEQKEEGSWMSTVKEESGSCALREEVMALAREAYARSIVVDATVTDAAGLCLTPLKTDSEDCSPAASSLFATAGSRIPLRYPMTVDSEGTVSMLYAHVLPEGTVVEYSVPVQKKGIMSVQIAGGPAQLAPAQ